MTKDHLNAEELLACPFCAGTSHLENNGAVPGGRILVHDGEPHCPLEGRYIQVEKWNTRSLTQENERLREAAEKFLGKLEECDPYLSDAFLVRQQHCGPYTGPTYAEELANLRTALGNNQ